MSEIRIVLEYQRPRAIVWKLLTDPQLVPLWTSTGQGGRPEGFKPEVGAKFRYVGKHFPGWDGIVRCEVLAVEEAALLRYDWRNKEGDQPTIVTNVLEDIPGGTRLTWERTGFHGKSAARLFWGREHAHGGLDGMAPTGRAAFRRGTEGAQEALYPVRRGRRHYERRGRLAHAVDRHDGHRELLVLFERLNELVSS